MTTRRWRVQQVRRKPDFVTAHEVAVLVRAAPAAVVERRGARPSRMPVRYLVTTWTLRVVDGGRRVARVDVLS